MHRFFRAAGALPEDSAGTKGIDRVLALIVTVSALREHCFCVEFIGYPSKNRHKLSALLADVGCDLAFCQGKSCPPKYSLFVKLVCLYQVIFFCLYILTYYLNVYLYNDLKSAYRVF